MITRHFVLFFMLVGVPSELAAETPWRAGFAKVDVTPTEPVRMSGYGSRDHPSEGVDTPLFVRAVALSHGQQPPHVLVSIDTIGLPGWLVRELTQQIEQRHRLPRQRIVVASTHTHTAPDLVSELSNIFVVELTEPEVAAGKRYRKQLSEAIQSAVGQALKARDPAQLDFGVGEAKFAVNRRVLTRGRWSGFGVEPDGPVDHSVPVLRIRDVDGKVRGVIFNYACHCTTLDGDYYRINGDWAGYAAADLEAEYPQAVAFCTIGCGADANPNPRGSRELSELHGRALSKEVKRIVDGEMTLIDQPIKAAFGYAGLSFELPTIEELKRRESDPTPQVRRHSEHFQKVYEREGRLPATYPVPIQAWRFGDQLTMIFLGGEVVADYALRLKRELPSQQLWVTAYANDVLGYIASERIRAEGGYEYDQSAILYTLPGPWAAGTEDLLIRRIHELLQRKGPQPPLEPEEALQSLSVPAGFTVQLVASEPLIEDPVNFAFGHDGSLWVVEMGDYPRGASDASQGGRIKRLTDTDGDGVFDHADVFLDDLNFPTGVHPWRDGVVVIAAPEMFLARDRDGDGRADEREVLYTGFPQANPQHRLSGFAYGLDHSLHCASGDALGELTLIRSGETVNASGHDVQVWPDSGELAAISGRTQYIRSRNDWGDWFGNDNSRPMYHFPIEDRYLARNSAVSFPDNKQQLFDPPVAPPVYPLSDSDRFNDLFAANRFTSACSAIVVRSKQLGPDLDGAALVCEPVHNLVHRAQLIDQGATFRAVRAATEQSSEFLRSTDPWFRPVRVAIGPDGMIWVADMYRQVIEHPEWIPQSWQQQLDLRAGSDRGRIYRIVPKANTAPARLPNITKWAAPELIELFESENGTLRDMAQQELLERVDKSIAGRLQQLVATNKSPEARVHALWTLHGLKELNDSVLGIALSDTHPGVMRNAVLLAESRIDHSDTVLPRFAAAVDDADPKVRLQLALTLGESKSPAAGSALGKLAADAGDDPWLARAIVSSSKHHSLAVLEHVLDHLNRADSSAELKGHMAAMITDLIATAKAAELNPVPLVARAIANANEGDTWMFPLAAACAESADNAALDADAKKAIAAVYQRAKSVAADATASPGLRCQALQMFGRSLGSADEERALLSELLTASTPLEVQLSAVGRLVKSSEPAGVEQLISNWSDLTYSVRGAAAFALLSTGAGTEALMAALESGKIQVGDVSPSVRQALRQSGSQTMQARINRVLGKTAAADQALIQKYLQYQSAAAGNADVLRGHELFRKHCAVCHVPDEAGRSSGPNLTNLTDRSPTVLTEAILAPNRAVEPQYRSYVVVTTEGQALSGIIAEEAGDTLTLALADGRRATVRRSEIDEFRNTGISLMPEGLQQELDPAMLRDLIEYLRSDAFLQSPDDGRPKAAS